jgi:serine protease
MKTQIKIGLAALFIFGTLIFAGCMKKPKACFDASKTNAAVNESITFTSTCSENAHHYEWDFGDGAKSTDASPSHAFANTGTYSVKLMTMSMNSKKDDAITKTVTIQ